MLVNMIVDLRLYNKIVIVIGGGIEGSRKVRGLLDQNCKIIVITNRMNKYLSSLQNQNKISVIKSRLARQINFRQLQEHQFNYSCHK
jgi:precorrin-2 dehydrogenase/sirohydrochlorin ferrochelatase